jgi:hypothetical protein
MSKSKVLIFAPREEPRRPSTRSKAWAASSFSAAAERGDHPARGPRHALPQHREVIPRWKERFGGASATPA